MTNNRIFKLYLFAYLILFLQTMHVWFLWGNTFKIVCPLFFLVAALLNHKFNPICYQKQSLNIISLFLILILFVSLRGSYDMGFLSISKSIVGVFTLYEIITLSKYTGKYILLNLTKYFGIISLISLIGWFIFLLGYSLPNTYIVNDEFGYSFYNYYIFLYNGLGEIPRFCSIFLEPGYYGQLAAIILFANKMRINNVYTITIFISLLFSLSLAGYVLVIMGFIFISFKKEYIVRFFLLFFLGYGLFLFFKNFNGGDNPINNHIISRLEIVDGKLSGDDRTTEKLDRYFEKDLFDRGQYLLGIGSAFEKIDWNHGVAGYKVYIVKNGYIGFFMAILCYLLLLFRYNKTSLHMKFCFVLFMAMYWQAAYPFWFSFFSIYIFTLNIFSLETKKLKVLSQNNN